MLILRQNGLSQLLKPDKQLQAFAKEVKGDKPSEPNPLYDLRDNIKFESGIVSSAQNVSSPTAPSQPELPSQREITRLKEQLAQTNESLTRGQTKLLGFEAK